MPLDEIASAIAAARGALLIALRLGKGSIAERPESRGAVRYDGSTISSSTVECELRWLSQVQRLTNLYLV